MHASPRKLLADFTAAELLPAAFPELAERWYLPLANWLQARCEASSDGGALVAGVHGAQGTGKTTLCKVLELFLAEQQLTAVTLSLDDFYLTRAERALLAEEVHPLLSTRGVPGTHDVALLSRVLDELQARRSCLVPRFDKSLDERLGEDQWQLLPAPDIVLLEGWCVGCIAESPADLLAPLNTLEENEDSSGEWRAYVNSRLASDYALLFKRLDNLVMLQAPSLAAVVEWRSLQEHKLARTGPGQLERIGVMHDAEIVRFVQHYERLTRHSLEVLPERADYLLRLNAAHAVESATSR